MSSPGGALAAAVQGEEAAVFAYGVIGAKLKGAGRTFAEQSELAHRNRRDTLIETMASPPPPAAAFYDLPVPVTDTDSALAAAVAVEERVAKLWRAVITDSTGDGRSVALDALTDGAQRAAAFRRLAGDYPGTTAFPGL